ncbi:MAG: bifunctional enoyl-CoA hydratase/phosphate acetyltransferase [Hyphomonadaceae bacterium]
MRYIENRTYDELKVGDCAEIKRTLREQDIELFAVMSGDINPAHVDPEYAKGDRFHKVIAHGMWGGALISAVLGTELPGPGTVYLHQSLNFHTPVGVGDVVRVRVTVREKRPNGHVILDCLCVNQEGEDVIVGEAEVIAPTVKVRRPGATLPEVHLHERGERFRELTERALRFPPLPTAVVHPCDAASITGAVEAAAQKLIAPVLVGPEAKVRKAAEAAGLDISGFELIDAPHSHAAAAQAAALARDGRVSAIMKGALHTDEVMGAIVKSDSGLRTERRMSHVFVFDVPHYEKLLLITDAAINIEPDLDAKKDIVQNAIDLARACGIPAPKVAILSAVETVYPKIRSTVEAAALCKMADRGQIKGGVLDGPLAFDNAISRDAAATKGIVSPVAGVADILLAPDLASGNMVSKQLVYLSGADGAGLVMGARVPVILTSRADGVLARTTSCALAQLAVHAGEAPQ